METILLVDDEPEIRDTLRAGIRRGIPDATVLTAPDGETALDLLTREPVDIVISDQRMPGMEGIDFLIHARRVAPGTHRMMLTAYPEQHLVERNVNDARIAHFFTKPYHIAEVLTVLRGVLDERRARTAEHLALAKAVNDARPRDAISYEAAAEPPGGSQ